MTIDATGCDSFQRSKYYEQRLLLQTFINKSLFPRGIKIYIKCNGGKRSNNSTVVKKTKNEEKFKTLEKERPNEMEMAA